MLPTMGRSAMQNGLDYRLCDWRPQKGQQKVSRLAELTGSKFKIALVNACHDHSKVLSTAQFMNSAKNAAVSHIAALYLHFNDSFNFIPTNLTYRECSINLKKNFISDFEKRLLWFTNLTTTILKSVLCSCSLTMADAQQREECTQL